MPDIADDRAAYLEAVRRAEEASGISRDADGNEVYTEGETPVVTPELEGAVPVQASDQPLKPEPVTPAVPAATDTPEQQQQEAPAVPPTLQELQQKLAAAEARLEEKESFIGRQSGEVGDLRKAVEEMQRQLQAQPVQQTPAQIIPITQELIDNNPAVAVQAAFAQQNEQALQVAFEAWKEIDPFTAVTWLSDKKLEQQQQAFDAKLAETQKQIAETTAPLAQDAADAAQQREWALAFNEVKATRPDFLDNAARLLEEVAPQYPSFLPALQSGDAKAKAEALSALYALDKMGDPQAVQAQLEAAAQEALADATAARAAAGVVTGQQTVGQGTVQKTQEELEQDAYVARQRSKPSLSKGWTGRS